MHLAWMALLTFAHLSACSPATDFEAREPYRTLPELDLRVFACAGDPVYHRFASRAELMQAIDGLAPNCPGGLRESFLRSLEGTSIRWDEESLLILEEYYGTGMARAHLELTFTPPDFVHAAIVWVVPPPPVTPDTAVYRFAFVVNESAVARVIVTGRRAAETVIPISR